MEEPIKKRGRKPIDPATKKRAYGIALTPAEIERLEEKAAAENVNPSQFIVRKLKLDKPAS